MSFTRGDYVGKLEHEQKISRSKHLRYGYTTGTCAAAATLAAATLFFSGEKCKTVRILTPKGIAADIEVEVWEREETFARCGVRKFAGDDPDITDGILIFSQISQCIVENKDKGSKKENENLPEDCVKHRGEWWYVDSEQKNMPFSLFLRGGEGVGRVTRKGLNCPEGMWAINPVPRRMIFDQAAFACRQNLARGRVYLTIEIPQGRELAEKTFNPRLGILGGLSILGSSGIVEPMSDQALLETIRLEIRQRTAEKEETILIVPGNYGEKFISETLNLSPAYAVKCSNFIGHAVDMAGDEGIREVLLVGHAGKLIKLAAGVMNTHSSVADARMECLAAYGAACGAFKEMTVQILSCVTVEEALCILEKKEGLLEDTMNLIMERIDWHLKKRAGMVIQKQGSVQIEAIMFTNERGILGKTKDADRLAAKLKRSEERVQYG